MKISRAIISAVTLIILVLAVPAASQYLEYINSTQWGGLNHMEIDNGLAYCGFGRGLLIYDVSDPDNIHQISQLYTASPVYHLAKSGNYIYAPVYGRGLRVIDVADPFNPEIVGGYDDSCVNFVAVEGDRAYMAIAQAVYVNSGYYIIGFNIQNPANPQLLWRYEGENRFRSMAAHNGMLCIVENQSGVSQGGGIRTLRGLYPAPPIDYGRYETSRYAHKVMTYNDHLYFLDNTLGLLVLDMSSPRLPRIIERVFPGDTTWVFCRDFTVSDNIAYALLHPGYDNCFLELYDVSDPTNTSQISRSDNFIGTYYEVNAGAGLALNHDESYDGNPQIQIVDITDPEQPVIGPIFKTAYPMKDIALLGEHLVVTHSLAGYSILNVADIYNPYLEFQDDSLPSLGHISMLDNYAVLSTYNYYSGDIYICDLTQPTSPESLAAYDALGSINDMAIIGNYAYLCVNNQGLELVDLSSPSNPSNHAFLDTIPDPNQIKIENNYAYVACGSNGMMILDIADPAEPSLAGYFYQYPINISYLAVKDTIAYLANSDYLTIVNIADPTNVSLVNNIFWGDSPGSMFIFENYLIMNGSYNSLGFYSLQDPAQPELAFNTTAVAGAANFLVRNDDVIINDGWSITFARFHQTGIDDIAAIPGQFYTVSNYPNPFNAQTTVRYNLAQPSEVTLDIYDILGRKVETLFKGPQSIGNHLVSWDASGFSSGVYFYKITSGTLEFSGEMLLLK